MLGGPGEAVTAWSRAIPRAMVRRCCLPAPGSSRRQTLTPKSCALRVFGTPSCDSSALALSIVMPEDPPPVATRPSFCSTCWPRWCCGRPRESGSECGRRPCPARRRAANRPHPSPVGRRSSQHPLPGVPGLRPRRAVSAVAALGGDQRSRPGGDRSRRADPRVRQRGQPPPAEIRSRIRARCAVPARQELIRTRRQRPRRGSSPGVDASFHTPAAFGTSQRLSGSTFV